MDLLLYVNLVYNNIINILQPRNNEDPFLIPFKRINSQEIRNLNSENRKLYKY